MNGAGAQQRTIRSVMDRLYVQVLTPPDDQQAQVRLAADIDADTTEIGLGGFTIPEDEALIRQGVLLELDQELVRVVSYNEFESKLVVSRGEYSTVPTAHTAPMLMNLNPPYPRATVFETVADNIITLSPKLFTVGQELLVSMSNGVYPVGDPLATEVLSITGGNFTDTTDQRGKIVDFHPMVGGRALITDVYGEGSIWLRYRRRMDKPTSEDDTLDELGVDDRWANIVIVGAAADLIVGRDLPAARTEWVKAVLESENIRVGTRMSIAGGLRQYRDMLLADAAAEMKAEYKTKIHTRRIEW